MKKGQGKTIVIVLLVIIAVIMLIILFKPSGANITGESVKAEKIIAGEYIVNTNDLLKSYPFLDENFCKFRAEQEQGILPVECKSQVIGHEYVLTDTGDYFFKSLKVFCNCKY